LSAITGYGLNDVESRLDAYGWPNFKNAVQCITTCASGYDAVSLRPNRISKAGGKRDQPMFNGLAALSNIWLSTPLKVLIHHHGVGFHQGQDYTVSVAL
jgi:hypothetical protein